MKALNRFLIIEKHKVEPKKVGGLIMTEKIDEDNRYIKGTVVSVGNLVDYISEKDIIYYDKHAGHGLSLNDTLYHVIRDIDVVIVE
jgi:co-chaperonin GroES (HSP10)|tara:strand:+ start:1933 stop:2190 length:258 start_codon:yes stop_codon:yes gene_type:complete